jgi:hypothetical protein
MRIIERILVLANKTRQSELERKVLEGTKKRHKELARKEVRSYLTAQAEELRHVEEFIVKYPPALPRSAKRMLNHARLLTRIARDRNVFRDDSPISPAHLGKWIVLSERWWSLAGAVSANPPLLEELEQAAEADPQWVLGSILRREGIDETPTAGLQALLRSEPPLHDVVDRLVRLEPGTPQAQDGASATSQGP